MKKKTEPRIFKSYPEVLPVFVAIFISGILVSENFTNDLYITWLCLSIASFISSFFVESPKNKSIILFLAAFTASMFYGAIRHTENYDFKDLLVLDNTEGILSGTYTGRSNIHHKNKISYTFKDVCYTTNEQTVSIPINVNCQYILNRERLYPEQSYSMAGKMKVVSFDKALVFEVASFTNIETKSVSLFTSMKQLQEKIKTGLNKALNEKQAAIVTGFVLGDTSKIKDKSIFTETGISHVLAISGQHIMILIFLLASIMHWFKIPPISRSAMIAIILVFYAMVTAGSPSIWRALIMYVSVAAIMHLESSSSPVRPVAIAAFIMLLYNPSYIKNAAFILSFTAVLSIIFLRQPFEFILSKLHLPLVLNRYLAVTFAANLGTMPMVAYLFGTLSLSSLIVNPLILWTFTFILPISFVIAFLSIFSISTVYLSSGLSILLDYLISFLEYVKNIPGLYFYVGNISPVTILCVYVMMLYLTSIFNNWQLKHIKAAYEKQEIEKIPVKQLPQEKSIEIHIDSKSKATPTLLSQKIHIIENKKNDIKENPNPFSNSEIVKAIDEMLSNLKRLKVKNSNQEIFSVNSMIIESQNIYHRLFEMEEELFKKEPERLLQAHIFMLALIGYELLNRLNSNLEQPIPNDILEIKTIVKDRYLPIAIIADQLMNSNLPNTVTNEQLKVVLNQIKILFIRSQKLLQQILSDKNFENSIKQHLVLRNEMVKCCLKFIQCDNVIKLRKKKNLR